MRIPSEHFVVVGRLWHQFEAALLASGASGTNVAEKIHSLRGRVPASLVRSMHYVRLQRNRLMHESRPLSDADKWERQCRHAIQQLAKLEPGVKYSAPTRHKATPPQSNDSESSGQWGWALGGGILAYMALHNEQLMVVLGLGILVWFVMKAFE